MAILCQQGGGGVAGPPGGVAAAPRGDNLGADLLPAPQHLPQPFQAVAADIAADFDEADDDDEWEDIDEEEVGEGEGEPNPQPEQRREQGAQANQGNFLLRK